MFSKQTPPKKSKFAVDYYIKKKAINTFKKKKKKNRYGQEGFYKCSRNVCVYKLGLFLF
jgi:hypothetical protein